MDVAYPTGPAAVPDNLTAPSRTYRRQAWLAMGGLLLFVAIYCALAGWFCWMALRLLAGVGNAPGDAVLGNLLGGAAAAFLAVFMLKALVFVKRGAAVGDLEVTATDQPALFTFLHRLADEAGAQHPHRVFLSGRVNAGVFYDLSLANLLIPSRKNLEIGLGLVNVLSLGELKAVLAHEFGHFAQRTMAVGRWVYIAQQVAGHIVARRDALDRFLIRLSRIDFRIAWIGWVLRIVVWSIRSVVDHVFRIAMLAQRALSREMEFQADLVAVSVTGSDALIHALHKLAAADQSWDRTVDFANSEIRQGRGVRDLFSVQTRVIDRVRSVLNDPDYGRVPAIPTGGAPGHRLFKAALAAPPKMWSTHPTNSDREDNAKRTYVAASIDDRSAWTLFKDAEALREQVTLRILPKSQTQPAPMEETLTRVDENYTRAYLDPAYRGAYLGRSIVRDASSTNDLFDEPVPQSDLLETLDTLYPESLRAVVERLRSLEEEKHLLSALRAGFLTAPGGVIRHRGEEISRKALPHAIEAVRRELETCRKTIRDHDKRCRTVHLAAARQLGDSWVEYLKGLLQLLHYADHVEANLLDARGMLANTFAVVTASGRVTNSGRDRILHAADTAYAALRDVHEAIDKVVPDRTVLRRLKSASWHQSIEELKLPGPTAANLGQWLNASDSWILSTASSLGSLRLAALEQLLATESQIARFVRTGLEPAEAPPPSLVPGEYRLLLPGTERQRATLDWWDRFQTSSGVVATIGRVIAAAAIIGAVLLIGSSVGSSKLYVLNGLGRPVVVRLGTQRLDVPAYSHHDVNIGMVDTLHVTTTTTDGRVIEEFDAHTAGSSSREVYNVASAGGLVSWEAAYGSARARQPRFVGDPRWYRAPEQYVFEDPPNSVSTKGGGATRDVLTDVTFKGPEEILSVSGGETIRNPVLAAHARWDGIDSPSLDFWVTAAVREPTLRGMLVARIQEAPLDPYNLRLEQEVAEGANHAAVCAKHARMAEAAPTNADLQYIAARCIQDHEQQGRRFLELAARFPQSGWVAFGAAFAQASRGQWQPALDLYERARVALPRSMSDGLAVEMARIHRVLDGENAPEVRALARQSRWLAAITFVDFPPTSKLEGSAAAYTHLATGNLQDALSEKGVPAASRARLVRMVAASDGAQAADIDAMLALPPDQGLDLYTYLSTLALLTRTGHDTAAYEKLAAKIIGEDDAPAVMNAFDLLRDRASTNDVEQALRGLDMEFRGQVYVAAAILRGTSCPPEWRQTAKRLLFSMERPFLR